MTWIVRDVTGKIYGPLTEDQVVRLIRQGVLTGEEFATVQPDGEWQKISVVGVFYEALIEALSSNSVEPETDAAFTEETPRPQFEPEHTEKLEEKTERSNEIRPNTVTEKKAPPRVTDSGPQKNKQKNKYSGENKQTSSHSKAKIKHASREIPPVQHAEAAPRYSREEMLRRDQEFSDEIVDLVKKKKLVQRAKKRRSVLPLLLLVGLAMTAAWLFNQPEKKILRDRIHLLQIRGGRPSISEDQAKEKQKQALTLYSRDVFQKYLQAQNLLVEVVEGRTQAPQAIKALCLVYNELWKFSHQDSQDFSAIVKATQMAAQWEPFGESESVCRTVQLLLAGQTEQAASKLKSAMAAFPTSPEFYLFKAETLVQEKDYLTALSYDQKAQQLWPTWTKAYVVEAQIRLALQQNSDAKRLLEGLMKSRSDHVSSVLMLGVLEYEAFKQAPRAQELLMIGLKKDRAESPLEAKALGALAEISNQKGNSAKALEYALESYQRDPTSRKIRKLIESLGGAQQLQPLQTDCQELISLGDQYSRSRNFLAAQAEYRAAYQVCEPKSSRAALKAGQSLWKLNQTFEAIEWVILAQKADPKAIEPAALLADFYSSKFEFEKAVQALQQVARSQSQNHEYFRAWAQVELRRLSIESAKNYAERALKLYDTDLDTHLVLTQAYLGLGDDRKAYQTIARAIELDRNHIEAQSLYAQVLARFQGTQAGVKYISDLIHTYPTVADYRVALGQIYIRDEHFEEALAALQEALQMDATLKIAHELMGQTYARLNRYSEALKAYLSVATLDPSDPKPFFLMGQLQYTNKKFDLARKNFESVLKINPRYPRAHLLLGRTHFVEGQLSAALQEAQQERKINPNLAEVSIFIGEIYIEQKSYSKAVEEFQKALKLRSQSVEVYILLARAHRLTGNLDIAQSMLNMAAAKESGNPEIYKEKGLLYERKQQNEQAVVAYGIYLERAPTASDRAAVIQRIIELGGQPP